MSKTEKRFDAVAMMRAAREKISAEIEGMSAEEELEWFASQELDDPVFQRLLERTAKHDTATDSPASGS